MIFAQYVRIGVYLSQSRKKCVMFDCSNRAMKIFWQPGILRQNFEAINAESEIQEVNKQVSKSELWFQFQISLIL